MRSVNKYENEITGELFDTPIEAIKSENKTKPKHWEKITRDNAFRRLKCEMVTTLN